MSLTSQQKLLWSDNLELKLRRVNGDAFESFFATMMEFSHPEGFVRVKALGALGDKKCDGYLQSTVEIFQCYGAENGGAKKKAVNAHLTKKMGVDYAGACQHWGDMTAWHMVHNFVDGVGSDSLAKLEELKKANPHHKIAFFGKPRFEKMIFALEAHQVEHLIGRVATDADFRNLQLPEVVAAMDAIMKATSDDLPFGEEVKEVPKDKLGFNKLSGVFQRKIAMGQQNASIVENIVDEHPNPLFGITVANEFKRRYLDLRFQDLDPNEIMTTLYDSIVGPGNASQERDVAAWSLLAFLFTKCTIFEDNPANVKEAA